MFSPRLGFRKKQSLRSSWTLAQVFDNYNGYGTTASDLFGSSSALSNNYMIIGAFQEDSAASNEDGKAYVYRLSPGNNTWLYTLTNPNTYSANNPGTGDRFGFGVAINDTYFAVSAHQEDDSATSASTGAVYVYNISDGSLRTTITDPNAYSTTASDFFGFKIAMTDDYLICSAPFEDPSSGTNAGVIYVYALSDMSLYWTLPNPNTDGGSGTDYFGIDIAAKGDYFIVGAHGASAGNTSTGYVYVYQLSTKSVVYSKTDPNAYGTSASDFFGQSVAISNRWFAASAPGEDSATANNVGYVYVYDLATGTLQYSIADPGTQAADDNMGSSSATVAAGTQGGGAVTLNDRYLAVGVRLKDTDGTNAGRSYIWDLSNYEAGPQTIACPNRYGSAASDAFGRSLFFNNDHLVITSFEDDAGGTLSGKAYLYAISSTEVVDSGRTAKAITTNGGVKFSTTQKKYASSSIYFDGDSDYLTTPDSTDWNIGYTYDYWTVEGWFYITNGSGNHLIGGNEQASSSNGWALFHEDGELKWFSKGVGSAEQKTSGASISTNTWVHIAVVGNGSNNVNIYANGTRYYSGTASQGYGDSTSVLNIGRGYGISSGQWVVSDTIGFAGYMEDIRISHVARYTGSTYTPPGSLLDDSDTKLLIKGGGTNNATVFYDYIYKL